MPFTLKGDFGSAVFDSTANSSGEVVSRYLTIQTDANLNFFRKVSIVKSSIVANSFGLFSFLRAGNNNRVRFAHLTKPRHLFSSRKNGCTWVSKGKIRMNQDEILLCPIEYKGEECPDFAYGDCLEKIYGTGNEVRDMLGTAEGRALFGEMINRIYEGLGDSFYELIWYGQHPLIDDADTNEWYGVEDDEWDDYVDQQAACGGLMTMVDNFKDQGLTNYNIQIPEADVSADRESFIGDAQELFDRVLRAQSAEMKLLSKRGANNGSRFGKTMLLVSAPIYQKFEDEIIAEWNQINDVWQYFYNGVFCASVGCENSTPVEGVLRYKGHWVVCMDEWDDFDRLTGTKTFRVMAVVPGNFGIAYDVPSLQEQTGFGLRVTQHLDDPWLGKTYMSTTFKTGTGIIDENYIVNASRTFVPA